MRLGLAATNVMPIRTMSRVSGVAVWKTFTKLSQRPAVA
jgi:hypothetical protein